LADARFAKPFDRDLICKFATSHQAMIIVEESSLGGFSAHVLQFMAGEGLLDNELKVRVASLPDTYIDHAERGSQLAAAGLDADSLFALAAKLVLSKTDSIMAKSSRIPVE
jgi:1-deoxy-D-xylulose-5-phosphate synthase